MLVGTWNQAVFRYGISLLSLPRVRGHVIKKRRLIGPANAQLPLHCQLGDEERIQAILAGATSPSDIKDARLSSSCRR